MQFKKKAIFVIFAFFSIFFLASPEHSQAADKFLSEYSANYFVSEDLSTKVTLSIAIQNKSSEYYPSSYKVSVGEENIENVRAKDSRGEIKPVVTKGDKQSTIQIDFNEKSVGLDNKLFFEISFISKNMVKKLGRITEVNIPGLGSANNASTFKVSIDIPQSLGEPSYVKPNILVKKDSPSGRMLLVSEGNLEDSGVYMAFGEYQVFNYKIKYRLSNKNLYPVKTEIALPPQTGYQDAYISSISPMPKNVRKDKDGNWLAEYFLFPTQRKEVLVKGRIRLNLNPKKEKLSSEEEAVLTSGNKFWEKDEEEIKQLASLLKTPESIYEYVVQNLTYDYERVGREDPRLGALKALNNPRSAVCLEFTDLFIALSRAADIPAREVGGYAYTQDDSKRPLSLKKDVLHAWPEYYDRGRETWIMVDPTWGNTTGGIDYFNILDFDHIAFVRKGYNSSYPVPPGGNKDIEINFANSYSPGESSIDIKFSNSHSLIPWRSVKGNIGIRNLGDSPTEEGFIELTVPGNEKSKKIYVESIPPFGMVNIKTELGKLAFLEKDRHIYVKGFGKEHKTEIKYLKPAYLVLVIFILGGGVAIIATFIWKITTKSRNLPL